MARNKRKLESFNTTFFLTEKTISISVGDRAGVWRSVFSRRVRTIKVNDSDSQTVYTSSLLSHVVLRDVGVRDSFLTCSIK